MGFAKMIIDNDEQRAPRFAEIERVRTAITRTYKHSPSTLRTARAELVKAATWTREAQAYRLCVADNMIRDVAVRYLGEAPEGFRWKQNGVLGERLLASNNLNVASVLADRVHGPCSWWTFDANGEEVEKGEARSLTIAKCEAIASLVAQNMYGLGTDLAVNPHAQLFTWYDSFGQPCPCWFMTEPFCTMRAAWVSQLGRRCRSASRRRPRRGTSSCLVQNIDLGCSW